MWHFSAPQLRVRHVDFKGRLAADLGNELAAVINGYVDFLSAGMMHVHPNPRGMDGERRDFQPVQVDMSLISHKQVDGTIDSTTRVPAVMSLPGYVCGNGQQVVLTKTQLIGQIHYDWRKAIRMVGKLLAVQGNRRVAVYAFQLDKNRFPLPLRGRKEALGILVGFPQKSGGQKVIADGRVTIGMNHAVMGQRDGIASARLHSLKLPIRVPVLCVHGDIPPIHQDKKIIQNSESKE